MINHTSRHARTRIPCCCEPQLRSVVVLSKLPQRRLLWIFPCWAFPRPVCDNDKTTAARSASYCNIGVPSHWSDAQDDCIPNHGTEFLALFFNLMIITSIDIPPSTAFWIWLRAFLIA